MNTLLDNTTLICFTITGISVFTYFTLFKNTTKNKCYKVTKELREIKKFESNFLNSCNPRR